MTRFFQVRIEDDTYKTLEDIAEKRGFKSLNALGVQMIAEWVGKAKGEPPMKAVPPKYQPVIDQIVDVLKRGPAKDRSAIEVLAKALHAGLPPEDASKVR